MAEPKVPLLSVGLPVYNGLPYLENALKSIRDSEFEDYELIVCDNCSTDGTDELVQDYASRDTRIRYVRNERNIGAARNYNKTFELGRGRYFRWAASDDLNSPGAVARCIEVLERDSSIVLAFPETRVIDSTGAVTQDYDDGDGWSAPTAPERFWYSLNRWGLSNTMYGVVRREILARTDLQGNYPASDLVMQSDLAIQGRFARIRGEYYYRRMHDRCTDSLDATALARFYDPTREAPFEGRMLRMFWELAHVVRRAPVSAADKRRLFIHLMRRARWERDSLARELGAVVRKSLRLGSASLAAAAATRA
jgi:glycosyltransferase involved in cell wall biosynthesis